VLLILLLVILLVLFAGTAIAVSPLLWIVVALCVIALVVNLSRR
jgi:hypothetical protein